MSTLRCFVGLPMSQSALDALEQCVAGIRRCDEKWAGQKWVRSENLHVTIAFLGNIEQDLVHDVSTALPRWASGLDGLSVRFASLEAVPCMSRASMIWARASDDGSSAQLAAAANDWLEAHGMPHDPRPFVPHVTMVRSRRPLHAPDCLPEVFASAALGSVVVSDPPITLFSSRLTAAGPVYQALSSFCVNGRS